MELILWTRSWRFSRCNWYSSWQKCSSYINVGSEKKILPDLLWSTQKMVFFIPHSLIRGVHIQSCSAGAKNFTNYEKSLLWLEKDFVRFKINNFLYWIFDEKSCIMVFFSRMKQVKQYAKYFQKTHQIIFLPFLVNFFGGFWFVDWFAKKAKMWFDELFENVHECIYRRGNLLINWKLKRR